MVLSGRWSVYLGIEGFSARSQTEDQVQQSLGELMWAIFRMGRLCYPQHPEQLFALQCGDGFLIASEFHEDSLERCATIAVAIMQHLAEKGRWLRSAISEGELSDIQDSFPQEVRECIVEDHTVSLHMGLMMTTPVMGSALIRVLALDRIGPRGPLLTTHSTLASRLGPSVPQTAISGTDWVSIDWVHMHSPLLASLSQTAALNRPAPEALDTMLNDCCQQQGIPEDWIRNVHRLLGVSSRRS